MAKKENTPAEEVEQSGAVKAALVSQAVWDFTEATEYGGKSDILMLNIGEIAGVLTYVGSTQMTTDLGEVTGHTATTPDGEIVRLPIAASFLRAVDQAALHRGDKFYVRRDENKIKMKGVGKGQSMQIYSLKLTERAPAPVAVD